MVQFKFVSKVIKREAILSNINLKIEEGEFLYLTGPSDSGKSTLLKLIYGIFPPTSGQLIVMGKNMSRISSEGLCEIRRRIGLIMPEFGFLEDETVEENLSILLVNQGVPRKERKIRINHILNLVELTPKRNCPVSSLSTSQRQQVRLARALISNPVLILADEPTCGLDEKKEKLILEILVQENQQGKTILLASSLPEDIAINIARSRTLYLENGRIVEKR
jgi:cell division transport system ATP-binding protein